MKVFQSILGGLIILIALSSNAQSPGDTIRVQTWNYSSGNRDTIINFPSNPNISYEKVIMRYAMRCKGANVSSGSNRNFGCGEWDYSCNTYVHNPQLADSLPRTISKYQITPNTSDTIFSSIQTYAYQASLQLGVNLTSIISEDTASVGVQSGTTNLLESNADHGKAIIHYTASELVSAGLIAGNIDAMELFSNTNSSVAMQHLRVGLKASNTNPFASLDTNSIRGFQNVYYHHYNFVSGKNRIQFHSPFNWNGTSDLLVEISYRGNSSNAALVLSKDNGGSSIRVTDDYSLNLFPSNYVEANSYQGIGSNGSRTVEAWIKTTGSGEISTWGSNTTGGKQSFRVVNGSGFIRLEINGGYIVGSTPVNDGEWHHLAYTFTGSTLNNVQLYVDGNLETVSSISSINMNTQNSVPFQISAGFHNRYFTGEIDQMRVWSAALNIGTIQDWMYKRVASNHLFYNFLELAYPIDSASSAIVDISGNQNDATFKSTNSFRQLEQTELFKAFEDASRPLTTFYQGTYNLTVSNDTILDSIPQTPFIVEERSIFSKGGSTQTDSIGRTISNIYPKFNEYYDINGNLVSTTISSGLDTIRQITLNYYQRNQQKVEIMSFVTPYGINLDLGQNGKAWYFDVTDFLPVLEGNRRMTMERGGQFQEEMDIQFFFIVGTPPADVKSIKQIWKVDSRSYSSINNNTYFAPRILTLDTSATRFKIRSAITGHGQQGEFIPRTHTIYANNNQFSRNVWKECAENPVYPQGGTWIYDRAGWCPGMATDVAEYDITSLVQGNTVTLDYNVSTASGTSNYIVSNQLVEYGSANFNNDARVENIRRPNNQTEFGRNNPTCFNPIVKIRNTGSNMLSSATIEVSINGGTPLTHNWSGSLAFMDEASVSIPVTSAFWAAANLPNNVFTARITGVNGGSDQYIHNNVYNSNFSAPDTLPNTFRLVIKTNNAANQNSISIVNSSGSLVFSRNSFSNNVTTGNVITLPAGCYQLRLNDTNDDGLSFFANNSGTGYFRIEAINFAILKNFNPDFGDRIEYYFTVDQTTALKEESMSSFEMYPNPAEDYLQLRYDVAEYSWIIRDAMGKTVKSGTASNGQQTQNIDLSSMAKGIYFIRIDSKEESILRKVVKR